MYEIRYHWRIEAVIYHIIPAELKKNIHSTSLLIQLIPDLKEALFISAMSLLSGRTLITGLSRK